MKLNRINKRAKKQKGFSLIELLVVVAIIGILAAVGVVAYTGYTATAKINAVKTQHADIAKFIGAEFQKCNLGMSEIFVNGTAHEDCPVSSSSSTVHTRIADLLSNTFKNAYAGSKSAFEDATTNGCTADSEGCHDLTYSTKTVTIDSYYADGDDSGTAFDTIQSAITAD